jgi:hypothetical protein
MTIFVARFPSVQKVHVIDHTLPELIDLTDGPADLTRPLVWSSVVHMLPSSIISLRISNLGGRRCSNNNFLTALTGLTSLTQLFLQGECYFSDVRPLASLTSLKTLDISSAHEILTDDQFRYLADLTNLTDLYLEGCHKLSTQGFATLRCFTALVRLDLTGTGVSEDEVLSLVATLTRITCLFLPMKLTSADRPLWEDEWQADCGLLRIRRRCQLDERPYYDVFGFRD